MHQKIELRKEQKNHHKIQIKNNKKMKKKKKPSQKLNNWKWLNLKNKF